MTQFDIAFVGLSIGVHKFQYEVGREFFENFANSPLSDGHFMVELDLEKKSNMMLLDFHIKGRIDVSCDRCLSNVQLDLEEEQELIVKFGEVTTEAIDNIMTLSAGEFRFNVAQSIYEYVNLMIPAKTVCEDAGMECDKELIDKLNVLSGQKDHNEIDPRWEELKKVKTK
ncbi:MAG: DUF177 domain-containing protein [Bacteroidia bacterium]|nr:DUF177 domain-containing protein [Bacteroidia bacterium]